MGAETPGEERGPRRVGDHNLVQTRAQVLAALQSDRSPRGWHSARQGARLHRRVLAWRGCWEGALVRSRESQGRTRPLCFGEGLSGHSLGSGSLEPVNEGLGKWGTSATAASVPGPPGARPPPSLLATHWHPRFSPQMQCPAQQQQGPCPLLPCPCLQTEGTW